MSNRHFSIGGGDNLKLLIIDDHREYCEAIAEYAELTLHNYRIECEVVHSGEEALSKSEDFEPSVLLIDAHLPDVNSFELLERFAGGCSEVVITSSSPSREIAESAISRGAALYLTKSTEPDQIEELFQKIITLAGERAGMAH